MPESHLSFFGLGIAPKLIDTLQKLKFIKPTPIQRKVIPSAIEGKDVIGVAQTGTGKTMAFGIPVIQRLANMKDAFALTDMNAALDSHIILIDDVTTTGATLAEAARPLINLGASVSLLAFAHA